jgi:hypothetical protein
MLMRYTSASALLVLVQRAGVGLVGHMIHVHVRRALVDKRWGPNRGPARSGHPCGCMKDVTPRGGHLSLLDAEPVLE